MSHRAAILILILLSAVLRAGPVGASDHTVTLRTVEGRVVAVDRQANEGGLALLQADISVEDEPGTIRLLLAPAAICDEIGFEVAEGDQLRARIFVDGEGPSRVQKVMNMSRGTMVRLRTLQRLPLWDSSGTWHGGDIRTGPGPHRIRAGPRAGRGARG